MPNESDVWQGTLALMILRTLETMGSLHGYGIARRIEQISEGHLIVLYGTIYPALLRLEQDGYIVSEWGNSENNGFVTPLVANGKVYVPAQGTVTVFGLQ